MSEPKSSLDKGVTLKQILGGAGIAGVVAILGYLNENYYTQAQGRALEKRVVTVEREVVEFEKRVLLSLENLEDKLIERLVRENDKLEKNLKEEIRIGLNNIVERSTQIDDRIISRIQEDSQKYEQRFIEIERRLNQHDSDLKNK